MICCVGEILADLIGSNGCFEAHVGGAPFNVAVNAKEQGAEVMFVGSVGKDVIGRFLLEKAAKYGIDRLLITTDSMRNTTLAFVSIDEKGERDFTFFRRDTADYHITLSKNIFDDDSIKLIHLGSLMLSERDGRKTALAVVKRAKELNKLISFDVNFRNDLYASKEQRNLIYKPFVDSADLLKFGLDELLSYTCATNLEEAVEILKPKGLLFVTDGAKGSYCFFKGRIIFSPSVAVTKVVDTTGAGDAFYGALLFKLEQKLQKKEELNEKYLSEAMKFANKRGAICIRHFGALKD